MTRIVWSEHAAVLESTAEPEAKTQRTCERSRSQPDLEQVHG